MTTITLPDALHTVAAPEGTPTGAESLASSLLSTASRFAEFASQSEALASVEQHWRGRAATAYGSDVKKFAADHAAMARTLKRVSQGVDVFAEQLRTLQRAHTSLNEAIATYNRHRSALYADVAKATDADAAEIAVFHLRARSLAATRMTLTHDITDLNRRVSENEKFLADLFRSADTVAEARQNNAGTDPRAAAALATKPGPDKGPKAMASWWKGLSESEQDAVMAAYPEVLGDADGLPARVRDEANRMLLSADLIELSIKEQSGTLSPIEQKRLKNARATEVALKAADEYVVPGRNEKPGGSLWLYDPDAFGGDGRVAVAVGDLDTAADVSIQIPGIATAMTDAPSYVQKAADLYESARYNGDGSSVATMFWLGYDTPHGVDDLATYGEWRAKDGGERLADAVDGLRASRPDRAHMTAIGHSYGSTTTSYAATSFKLDVDDVALIGSPGAGPADHASDLSVGADHVYDGRNSRDLVGFLGDEGWARKSAWHGAGLGVDPSSRDFGAQRFEAESVHRGSWRNLDDHSRYFDRDSESLYNLGRIVDGHGENIVSAEHSYDPWWRLAVDPEKGRTPTSNEPGRSDTGN